MNAISSDEIRRVLADDPTDQSIHSLVFATIRYLVRQRLRIGRAVTYVDATHLTRKERKPYLRIGVPVEALFFDTPLEVCIARNANRPRIVPEDAIRKMAGKLQPPTLDEGLVNVTVIRPDTAFKR